MRVTAAGQSEDFTYDTALKRNSDADMKWETRQFQFTAVAHQTTLELFNTMAPGSWGPALDSVSVTIVPEPREYALLVGCGLLGFGLWRHLRA
jgi:hypothetical protein